MAADPERPGTTAPGARASLRTRITFGVLGYLLLLTGALMIQAEIIHEAAERLVLGAVLDQHLDEIAERLAEDPDWRPDRSAATRLYVESSATPLPAPVGSLQPGFHDDVMLEGVEHAVVVRGAPGARLALALDIDDFEQLERDFEFWSLAGSMSLVLLLALVVAWGVGRLVGPLRALALGIARLRPDTPGQRIELADAGSREIAVIAQALDAFLQRQDQYLERERAFVDSVSHELRTPVAVIAGSAELALGNDLPPSARQQLQRILRSARNVEQLVSMLLILARDPQRLQRDSDRIALDQLLPEIIADHHHLCAGKELDIRSELCGGVVIEAPVAIVQAAIGNLLRNAIENSDSGTVEVHLDGAAVVTIRDPGHGMSPEQISAIYARQAREAGRGGGIGLDLIGRLCRHLGWQLRFASPSPRGTIATLDLSASRVAGESR